MKASKLIICLLFIIGLAGCNDEYIDKFPLDKPKEGDLWKTVDDLKLYANQFYHNQMGNPYAYNEDNKSDNQGPQSKNSYIWDETVIPVSGGGWAKKDWELIRSHNYFLQRYQRVEGDPDKINVYLGEILFFKAFGYYWKVAAFGDVPWLDKDLTESSEELYNPRDSRVVIVDKIIDCLDKAASYLPETSDEGRLTKYTALALKSRVALYEGTYRKYHGLSDYERLLRACISASKEIMERDDLFELYSTGKPETDYHDFFQLQSLKGVKEAIFHVEYITDKRQHNRVRSVRESKSGMTKDFAESFLCMTDGLPISLSPDYKGDAEFMNEFENRDYRMKQTIYTPDRPIFITISGDKEFERAPIFTDQAYTGYRMYKMYSPYAADNEYEKCTIDDCAFRFAEVLLNYAEAKAELEECDQTELNKSINLLRARAGMPDMEETIPFVDSAWPNWEVAVSPLINEIRRERRIELASEGFRWYDLCRWKGGKLLENPKTYLGARDPATGQYRVLYSGFTRKWDNKLYLQPIPTSELAYNPNLLPQNPGWN